MSRSKVNGTVQPQRENSVCDNLASAILSQTGADVMCSLVNGRLALKGSYPDYLLGKKVAVEQFYFQPGNVFHLKP